VTARHFRRRPDGRFGALNIDLATAAVLERRGVRVVQHWTLAEAEWDEYVVLDEPIELYLRSVREVRS
jgi:hypothetical protein